MTEILKHITKKEPNELTEISGRIRETENQLTILQNEFKIKQQHLLIELEKLLKLQSNEKYSH